MTNIVRIKRRAVGGLAGAPASLKTAELAWNHQDDIIYGGYGDDGSGNATSVVVVGGRGAFATLSSTQTITGDKTFSGVADFTAANISVATVTLTDNTTKPASTGFVQGQFPSVTGATKTKITYNAKGLITAGADLTAGDIPTLTSAKISDFDSQVRSSRLDQMAAPAADVSMNSHKLTGVTDPTSAQDAATKAYVDSVASGLDVKASVRMATTAALPACTYNNGTAGVGATLTATANGALSAIDGISPVANNRILVKNQASALQNGLYDVTQLGDAGNPFILTRCGDANQAAEVTSGLFTFVEEGTANGATGWLLSTTGAITIGTTGLAFTQFSSSATYTADETSLHLAGSQFSIKSTWAGHTAITTLGTLTTAVWNATIIALGYGGTGRDLSGDADGSIFKKSGTQLVVATAGTDYLNNASTIDGGTF